MVNLLLSLEVDTGIFWSSSVFLNQLNAVFFRHVVKGRLIPELSS